MVDKDAVCEAIYNTNIAVTRADGSKDVKKVFKAGYFILTSGKISPFYIDTRVLPASPGNYAVVLSELIGAAEEIVDTLGANKKIIVSSESAGLAWGSPTAYELDLPWGFVRKDTPEFAGAVPENSVAIGVDDLITTMKTTSHLVNVVRTEGATINNVLVLVDRQEYKQADAEKLGIKVNNLVTVDDLVAYGHNKGKLEPKLFDDIQAYKTDESQFAIRALQGQTELLLKHSRWPKVRPFYEKEKNQAVLKAIDEILADSQISPS